MDHIGPKRQGSEAAPVWSVFENSPAHQHRHDSRETFTPATNAFKKSSPGEFAVAAAPPRVRQHLAPPNNVAEHIELWGSTVTNPPALTILSEIVETFLRFIETLSLIHL